MKKNMKTVFSLTIALAMALCLTACGGSNPNKELSGTYTAGTQWNQVAFTFDGDEAVTLQASAVGYDYYTQEGTYAIDEDGGEIVLSFPTATGSAVGNMTSYSGTFTFSKGEDHILIGGVRYTFASEDASSEQSGISAAVKENEQALLSGDALMLPDSPYEIVYSITDEGENGGVTYTQSMIATDEAVAVSYAGGAERYVFEKLDSGKYAMYVYDNITNSYVSSASSPLVQTLIDQGVMSADTLAVEQAVVAGYCARMTECYDCYKAFSGGLTCEGVEQVGGSICLKYTAPYQTAGGIQTVAFWIDPQTGVCMKGEYFYENRLGSAYAKTIECAGISTESISLPDYRQ